MLQLLISDYSLNEAAEAMGIPLSTADKYAAKIRDAFDCHTTCGAVAQAVAGGHVTVPRAP
ncbi:MAG TPA: hypothetical protein VN794_18635 [Methylomirabilota bacterium]|nr:hypothetical protein [Methylomirabilota bacterium]